MSLSQIQLDQCQGCKKRGFSKTGIVCSISNNKDEFNGDCKNFEIDVKVEKINKRIYSGRELGVWGGTTLIIIGVLWFVLGIALLDMVFIWPLIMIISGIVTAVRGSNKKKKKKINQEILDDEIY